MGGRVCGIEMKWLYAPLVALLLLVRVPSVAQPAGGDQALYAYVGQAITRGELPYRDAWDQKPPGIHYTYALMSAVLPHDGMVGVTDLLVAAAIAMVLIAIGRCLAPGTLVGELAACLFLLLGNPAFNRLGGIWVRAQCETFIALACSLALFVLARRYAAARREARADGDTVATLAAAGGLLGMAVVYKYNAAAYLGAAIATCAFARADTARTLDRPREDWLRDVLLLCFAFLVPIALVVLAFGLAGDLGDFYQATVVYNMRYSGETYRGVRSAVAYLLTFPIGRARVDGLWLLGGFGAAVCLIGALRDRRLLIVPFWVAAACLAIAVNGSRGLPQYFVQAAPFLALAAATGIDFLWRRWRRLARFALAAVLAVAVFRVTPFDKAIDSTRDDLAYLTGRADRDAYLSRFGGQRANDKYSALAARRLGDRLKDETTAGDKILIFGFSASAYLRANRPSASRFFWSRPIIAGFNEGQPRYGADGLLAELKAARPRAVVLQQRDWPAEISDSATFFLRNPPLASWLHAGYQPVEAPEPYLMWVRRAGN